MGWRSRSDRLGNRICLVGLLLLLLSPGCSVTNQPDPHPGAGKGPGRLEWGEWREFRYGYTVRHPSDWEVTSSARGDVVWISPAGDGPNVRSPGIHVHARDEDPTQDPGPLSKADLLKGEGRWPNGLTTVTEVEDLQVQTVHGPAPGFLLYGEGEADGHPYQAVQLILSGSGHSISLLCSAPAKEWGDWAPVCHEVARTFVAGDLTWGDLSHLQPPTLVSGDYEEWVAPIHGYRLRYPKGWAVADSFGGNLLWISPGGMEVTGYDPSIAVFVSDHSPLGPGERPGSLLQPGRDYSYVGLIRTADEATVETIRGPVPGLLVHGSGPFHGITQAGLQLKVAGRGHAIDLVCMAPESEWDLWRPMCDEVIGTFRAGDLEVAHPDPDAPYRPLWQIPLESGLVRELYVAAGGDRLAVRMDDLVRVWGLDGAAVEIPVRGHVAPLPDLSIWLMKPRLSDGMLEARGIDGKLLWQSPAPAGELYVSPDGSAIVVSWDGHENELPRTAVYGPDGRKLWHTTQYGGTVSFTERGDFLVWERAGLSWHLVSPAGEVLRSGNRGSASSVWISRDGRFLLTEDGTIETLDGQVLLRGPGPLLTSDGRNLHLFGSGSGGPRQVMAYDTDGRLLWSRDRELGSASVAHTGAFVFGWHQMGLWIWDGIDGKELGYLPGVKAMALSSTGEHLVVLFPESLAFMTRSR